MAEDLAGLITLRCYSAESMGDAYVQYFNEVIGIIEKVYKSRYGSERVRTKNNSTTVDSKPNSAQDSESILIDPDYETFETSCFNYMEDELVYILNDKTFESETQLKRHIAISFENILQEQIDRLTPGLATRKKQIYRVLRNVCKSIEIRRQPCWRLNEYERTNIITYEKLKECAEKYQAPPLRYPRPGARIGPSISDGDMQEYLLNILRDADGLVKRNDLISLIMHKYSIKTVRKVDIIISPDESDGSYTEEERLSILGGVVDEEDCLSISHSQIAEMIVDRMDDLQKDIYVSLYFKELSQSEIAEFLGRSDATISNGKKKIEKLLTEFLFNSGSQLDVEEAIVIIRYISLIIDKKKREY